ncbi:MAG: 4Fe-4S dicluster domain-containing protein [Proteobacteria bacterium]|nr:4Fe-4S dicluster domain-containing protein [Pseudomonadota bacterium]
MTDQEIYQKFFEYMDSPLYSFPESEHRLPMIAAFISPEEAAFLIGFPLSSKTLEEIAEIKQMGLEELKKEVKRLCVKGLVYESIREGGRRYRLWTAAEMFARIPFWRENVEESAGKMAPHFNKYWADGYMDQVKPMRHPGLRAIPIEKTVEMPTRFAPFEDILQVVDNYEYYTVSHCPCRARFREDPDYEDSRFPSEVCLHFNELGRYCVENGLGREITKEETLEILKKSAEAGLVHGIADYVVNPDTICNCDLEYCTWFRKFHVLDHDKAIYPSNYRVKVTESSCRACGLCARRCPVDAIQFKASAEATNKFRKAVTVDDHLCIGCGVCVYKCKSSAIVLERKPEEEITRSPETVRDLVKMAVMERFEAMQNQNEKN